MKMRKLFSTSNPWLVMLLSIAAMAVYSCGGGGGGGGGTDGGVQVFSFMRG
jgi:hypothetical protein